ncbi:MAG: S-layer homology domain-containing protein [Clostridia bacterium]|nr:S-layer homology domain-containing protein [Clostridia bacterium]
MKKLFCLLLSLVMFAGIVVSVLPAGAAKVSFSDVADDRWSASSVSYAVSMGYMNGVGGDRFDPSGPLTRAMVATVLWRREGSPAPAAPSGFEDVPDGKWYTDAVAWAKETGIVNGLTPTTFGPNSYITREQLGTMLFRFSSSAPVSVPERADLSSFSDDEKVSGWADEAMKWAVEAGLINGMSGNRLAPEGKATREQFAAIIERYDNTFKLKYNTPVLRSHYTEKDYPLVTDADFYVSTTGSDENDGSFEHPFATWNKAVEAVRAVKDGTEGITVAFMAGNYGPLSVTMTAADSGTEDSPITYCAYGDGDVIFDDGFTVAESEFVPLDAEDETLFTGNNKSKIMKADISGRLVDYDPVSTMILSDDGMCTLARFPNVYDDGSDQLIRGANTVDENHIVINSILYKNRMKNYHTTDGLILYGYITLGWFKDYIPTGGVQTDPETGDFTFYIPHPENTRGGHLRFEEWFPVDYYQISVVNISEELDNKGEYWIDPDTMTLYVYSPSGDYNFTGGSGVMLNLGEADHIALRGLTFRNSAGRMIEGNGNEDIRIAGCRFTGCSADIMVDIGNVKNITVRDSEFSNAAKTALDIWGNRTNERYYVDTGVRIDNNLFTRTGLVVGNSGALSIARTCGTQITHNEFRRCCWEGVDFRGACDMIAEYNVFDEVCCNGDDTGALNNWSSYNLCGNIIRHNLFVRIKGGTNGRFCAYLDDSAGTGMYSNLFFDCDEPQMNHDICKNNEFVNNVTILSGWVAYNTHTMEFVEEAVAAGDLDAIRNDGSYKKWVSELAIYESDPELKAALEAKWPAFFRITTDLDRVGDGEFCLNNSITVTGNRAITKTGKSWSFNEVISKYSVIEDNIAYSVEQNPLFVNPTRGDYRLRDGVEFPDVEFESMGRY